MRQGAKPGKTKVEGKRAIPRKSLNTDGLRVRELETRLAESLEREKATGELLQEKHRALTGALEQQTATSELLKVIGRSTFDLQPVFETLAENAVRLCAAERAFIYRFDGEILQIAATHNVSPTLRAFVERNPFGPGRQTATGRAAVERRTIHIHDIEADPDYKYGAQQVDPLRTVLAVPMLRAGRLLGVIFIYRHEVLPFTDSQIVLMETFADQAAIAIENVRLFTELQEKNRALTQAHAQVIEALEQQTVTSEVLKVISRSAFDLTPVLQTLAENATRLCSADSCVIRTLDGEVLGAAAEFGMPSELKEFDQRYPLPP